jgi:hypothetical protein
MLLPARSSYFFAEEGVVFLATNLAINHMLSCSGYCNAKKSKFSLSGYYFWFKK